MPNSYAIITGGAGCLGQAIAHELIHEHRIMLIDSNSHNLKKAVTAFASPKQVESKLIDVTDMNGLQQLAAELLDSGAKVSILVNGAGVSPKENGKKKTIENISVGEWEEVMRVNLTSMFHTCKVISPIMKTQKYGRIINISSLAGRTKSATAGIHYCSSKAGVLGFTRALASELAPFNILVNAVAPGKVANDNWPDNKDQLAEYVRTVPLGRLAEAREIAQLIGFLASEKSSYITGTTIDINGGRLMI